jgi:hypothetical protein
MSKKIMNMLLTLLFNCLTFSGLCEFGHVFKHPCTVHAFLPERLPNHCQGLLRTFSETCTFDAVPMLDPLRYRIRTVILLQIIGRKESAHLPSRVIFFYTDSYDMLILLFAVASRYCNCCTEASISPVTYGYLS